MLFVEFRFFVFFAFVFGVYWTLRSNTARKAFLLACNHAFYACFFFGNPAAFLSHVLSAQWQELPDGWWFPFVLIASTCMDYAVGIGIAGSKRPASRRAWMLATIAVNIGVLCYFKYFNFFVTSVAGFLDWLGLRTSLHALEIILPYGVSFYTFQSMSYTIEVYRGKRPAERSFLNLAFFISFFPALVAGPIVRAIAFLPQTYAARRWADVDVRGALVLFLVGFVKKACVAETVAPSVDQFFAAPESYTALSAWIAVILYATQIFCDFSGYTDMAIAAARLLGYELTINFDFPYFATSVTDFWRRWHVSLSTWLRDYLYFSLGGNRGSKLFTYRNLMLTMLLGGLWHGANWTFVIWGALHGVALVVHREWAAFRQSRPVLTRFMGFVCVPLTFYWALFTWIFFRAPDFTSAAGVLEAFVFWSSPGTMSLDVRLLLLIAGCALIHWLNFRGVFSTWWRRIPAPAFAAAYGAASAVVLLFVPTTYKPFIYFQF